MKTIYILIIALVFTGVSCDNFLNEELQGRYTSQTFYKTQDQALDAVTSAYNSLLFNNTDNSLWVFGDVASDDAVKGSLPGDQIDIQYIDQFNVLSSNSELLKMWQCYYEGISRSNIALYYIPGITMNEELKSRLLGEAKFLRAFYYFHLTNIFGNIPLKLNPPLSQADINVPASEVSEIYAQIEKDLNEAIEVLPATYGSADLGRVTKGAALGMLAKTYLFEEKYQDVIQTIDKIDLLGIYSLTPLYRENFEAPTQDNQETVFAVHHLRGSDPSLGSYLNVYFGPRGADSTFNFGYCFDAPVQDFVNEFEVTADTVVDPRLDYSIGRPGTKWINGEDYKASWSPTTYLSKKHIQPFSEVSSSFADSYLSYVYMRYADILLMKSEALNELGQIPQALVPLNLVRKRARESYLYDSKLPGFGSVPAGLLPDITTSDQAEARTAIRHERRVELGFEFHRYFDLMRYGKEAAEDALAGTNFSYDKNRYFPIPLLETENNPMLQ
jgi:starch-binding outer membrane protein, SusD/RagB family